MMDRVVNNNPGDFHASGPIAVGTSGDAQANHYVRVSKFVTLRDGDPVGAVLFRIPVNVTMDATSVQLAAAYERYSISDLQIDIQSTSPLGTSSGGMQICYISDPANTSFNTVTSTPNPVNVTKAVRQSGSVFVRPRDSCVQKFECHGSLFTKAAGDVRTYSYGEIVGVTRVSPTAGDTVQATITLTCGMHFHRTAVVDNNVTVTMTTVPEEVKIVGDKLLVKLPPNNYSPKISVRSTTSYKIQLYEKMGSHVRSRYLSFDLFDMLMYHDVEDYVYYVDLNKYVSAGNFVRAVFDSVDNTRPLSVTYDIITG